MLYKSNIRHINFLDKMGYNLSCAERPLATILENYKIGVIFIFLLFKELDVGFFSKNMRYVINKYVNFEIKNKIYDYRTFNNCIKFLIKNNKNFIIYGDNFYSKNNIKFFNKEHYKHPFIINGYDEENNSFYIIDEDLEKLKKCDKYIEWPYKQSWVSDAFIKNFCCNWNGIQGKKFIIDIITKKEVNDNDLTNLWIKDKYILMQEKILNNQNEYDDFMHNKIEHFFLYGNKLQDVSFFYNHLKAVNRQIRFFCLLFEKNLNKGDVLDTLIFFNKKLKPRYSDAHKLMIQYIYDNNINIKKSFYGHIKNIFKEEMELYKLFKNIVEIIDLDDIVKWYINQ
ncbi:MAG: hypothetical protein Q4D26_11625 [Clostridia bacterium]|nr:hypothetical protein [Clostridia bacterium]